MESDRLLDAIKNNDAAAMTGLLDADPALVDWRPEAGPSPILLAVYYGRPQLANEFIQRGASPTLHEACALGDAARVRELLNASPESLNAYGPDGHIPLGLACFLGHAELAKYLMDQGADVNIVSRNAQRVTPLHAAAARDNVDLARALLERGADANAQQEGGFTPMMHARHTKNEALIHLLEEFGAVG